MRFLTILLALVLATACWASDSFTSVSDGATVVAVANGASATLAISGTFVATVALEKQNGAAWSVIQSWTSTLTSQTLTDPGTYRFACTAYTSGTAVCTITLNAKVYQKIVSQKGVTVFQVDDNGVTSNGFVGPVAAGGAVSGTTLAASAAGGVTIGTDVATGTTNIPGYLKLWSNGDNAFYSAFQTGTQTGSVTYTLPTAGATVAGQVLTDAAANGVLSWATPAGGGIGGLLDITSAGGTTVLTTAYENYVVTGTLTQTLTLPACATNTRINILNLSTSIVTVQRAGSDTLKQAGQYSDRLSPGGILRLTGDGTNWDDFSGIDCLRVWRGAKLSNAGAGETSQAIGQFALSSNTTGTYNQALGQNALAANTTGINNQGVGDTALTANTQGSCNQATGDGCLQSNTTGSYNAAYGNVAGLTNTDGTYNLYLGASANGTDHLTDSSAIGANSTFTKSHQMVLGSATVTEVMTPSPTLVVGSVKVGNLGAATNLRVGNLLGTNTGAGANNTLFGRDLLAVAGSDLGYGSYTGFGYSVFPSVTTGGYNCAAFGDYAGNGLTSGATDTFVGSGTNATAAPTATDSTALGYNAAITASHQVVLGGSTVTSVTTTGTVSAPAFQLTVPTVAGTYTGTITTLTSTETQAIGDAVKIDANGKAHLAKADSLANAGAIFLSVHAVTNSAANTYALPGAILKLSSSPSWTPGALVYLSVTGTTGNTLTTTAPSASTNIVQIVGVALGADVILWQPQLVMVTIL